MTLTTPAQEIRPSAADSEEQAAMTLDAALRLRKGYAREVVNVDEPTLELVVFRLAGGLFALPGSGVQEILAELEVFWVPGTPASLEGVVNIRGNIESVVSLYDLLQLQGPAAPPERAQPVLLAQATAMRSGVRVDAVVDVTQIPQSRLRAPPDSLPEHLRPYVMYLTECCGEPVTVLDLERVFADYAAGLG